MTRGIDVANAQPDHQGSVNPIFTWVHLARRVPVRIHNRSGGGRRAFTWSSEKPSSAKE